MTNFQCKKLNPLVTGDIGSFCVDCLQDTNFRDAEGNQTFKFVNRMPCDRDVYDGDKYIGNRSGWLCIDCNWLECDRCDEKIYCDEDVTCQDLYGYDKESFDDGAYRVHEHCLTKEEKKKFDEVYAEEESDYEKYKDDPRNLANDPRFKHLQKEGDQ